MEDGSHGGGLLTWCEPGGWQGGSRLHTAFTSETHAAGMNGQEIGLTVDLWGLVSLVTLIRVAVGIGVIAAVAWLVTRLRRPDRG